jgi:hypothetical protein
MAKATLCQWLRLPTIGVRGKSKYKYDSRFPIPDSRFPIPDSRFPMSKELPYIVPSPQPQAEEVFAVHQTSHEFYQEVNVRLEFKQHCEWYQKTANQNRRDLGKMRRELNIMSWFCRR